ncbi:cell wall anchor, partial [Enterococcus faecalis]
WHKRSESNRSCS